MSATSPHPVGHSPSPNLDPPRDHLQAPGKGPYLSGTSSQGGSEASLLRVKNLPGYNTPVFKGKAEQHAKVQETVAAKVSAGALSALISNQNDTFSFPFAPPPGFHSPPARSE